VPHSLNGQLGETCVQQNRARIPDSLNVPSGPKHGRSSVIGYHAWKRGVASAHQINRSGSVPSLYQCVTKPTKMDALRAFAGTHPQHPRLLR
jgi:hypothetical protein